MDIKPVVLITNSALHVDPEWLARANLLDGREGGQDRIWSKAAGEPAGFSLDGRQPPGRFDTTAARGVEQNLVVRRFESDRNAVVSPVLLGDDWNTNGTDGEIQFG